VAVGSKYSVEVENSGVELEELVVGGEEDEVVVTVELVDCDDELELEGCDDELELEGLAVMVDAAQTNQIA